MGCGGGGIHSPGLPLPLPPAAALMLVLAPYAAAALRPHASLL